MSSPKEGMSSKAPSTALRNGIVRKESIRTTGSVARMFKYYIEVKQTTID